MLADAWYPAPWPRLSELAPAPTIDLTVHLRSPLPAPGPLLLGRFRSRYVRDGFFEEDGELWSADGTLVAQSRQLGLLIGATADEPRRSARNSSRAYRPAGCSRKARTSRAIWLGQLVGLRQPDSVLGRHEHRRRQAREGQVRGREALSAESPAAVGQTRSAIASNASSRGASSS